MTILSEYDQALFSKLGNHDQDLVRKACEISKWNYRDIDALINKTQSPEAADCLRRLRFDLQTAVYETL